MLTKEGKIMATATVNKQKKKFNINIFAIIVFVLLILYTLSFVLPLAWGLMTSLKCEQDFNVMKNVIGLPNFKLWDKDFDHQGNILGNYIIAFKNLSYESRTKYMVGIFYKRYVTQQVQVTFTSSIINTFALTIGCSVFFLAATVLTGYVCAKYRYWFSDFVYAIVIFTMVMPVSGTTPALIKLLKDLCLYNTIIGMCLGAATFYSMYFLIFYGFFKDLPNTYNEAAEIDGASQFSVMIRICVPLASKMMTTVLLLRFVHNWNDYATALYFLPTKATLAYSIFHVMQRVAQSVPRKIAILYVLALPILLLFVFTKKRLMGNISIGGIKE